MQVNSDARRKSRSVQKSTLFFKEGESSLLESSPDEFGAAGETMKSLFN